MTELSTLHPVTTPVSVTPEATEHHQAEAALALRVHAGDPIARHELFERYADFAARQAIRFAQATQSPQEIIADLVSAAHIGLLTAIDGFHPERFTTPILLATFARRPIFNEMVIVLRNDRYRGLVLNEAALKKLNPFKAIWFSKLGSMPDTIEKRRLVAQMLKTTIGVVGFCLTYCSLDASFSTDQPVATSADGLHLTLGDTLPAPCMETDAPLVEKETAMARQKLHVLLTQSIRDGVLTEREYLILIQRTSLDGAERSTTLEELAQQFGISRERVRQIEQSALKKVVAAYRSSLTDLFLAHTGHLPRRA